MQIKSFVASPKCDCSTVWGVFLFVYLCFTGHSCAQLVIGLTEPEAGGDKAFYFEFPHWWVGRPWHQQIGLHKSCNCYIWAREIFQNKRKRGPSRVVWGVCECVCTCTPPKEALLSGMKTLFKGEQRNRPAPLFPDWPRFAQHNSCLSLHLSTQVFFPLWLYSGSARAGHHFWSDRCACCRGSPSQVPLPWDEILQEEPGWTLQCSGLCGGWTGAGFGKAWEPVTGKRMKGRRTFYAWDDFIFKISMCILWTQRGELEATGKNLEVVQRWGRF